MTKPKSIEEVIKNTIVVKEGKCYYNRKPFNFVSDWFEIAGCDMYEPLIQAIKDAGYIHKLEIQDILDKILEFIDGERIVCADTKKEQINGQGQNQAYDCIEQHIKSIVKRIN